MTKNIQHQHLCYIFRFNEFMKLCGTDIKTDGCGRCGDENVMCVAILFWKKLNPLTSGVQWKIIHTDFSVDTTSWSVKDIDFLSDEECWDGVLNFELSIVSLMLHYGDIIFFPSKFKFDHVHIFTSFLISE